MLPIIATMLGAVVFVGWASWKRRWMAAALGALYLAGVSTLLFEWLPPIAFPLAILGAAVVNALTTRPRDDVDDESIVLPTPSWLVTLLLVAFAVGAYFSLCR